MSALSLFMKKILVVDDKPSMSQLMVRFLQTSFEVTTKNDGLQAISWLQSGNIPDIILTDLQMPNMDGIELIKRIKESGYFNDIPIIVLSSKESSNVRVECLKLGAEDYIMKPFNPEELMIRIERLIK
jgi:Response regulators consisting of a CheY-like receiver domain and a winged-helix DNA-binding domain